ncbi:MAG TPA: PIN domain-containing protein [Thermoanaerobaculia bacterium]
MNAYIDSGVFIDYLVGRGHAGSYLRSAERRGRTPAQLGQDAEMCLTRLAARHVMLTSPLTCYEVEEALYRELKRSATGVAHGDRFIVPAARAAIVQTLVTTNLFGIRMIDLTAAIVASQCQNIELQMRGVRAADALHVTTAVVAGADVILSADDDILKLDRVFTATSGNPLRCVDTDVALTLIP